MSACACEFEVALDAVLKAKMKAALANPAPSIPQAEVFDALRVAYAKRKAA